MWRTYLPVDEVTLRFQCVPNVSKGPRRFPGYRAGKTRHTLSQYVRYQHNMRTAPEKT